MQARHVALAPLYTVKRLFVQRRAVQGRHAEAGRRASTARRCARELGAALGEPLDRVASPPRSRTGWMTRPANEEALELAARYAAWATLAPAGRAQHQRGVLFKVPHKLDMHHLVPVETGSSDGVTMLRLPTTHHAPARGLRADRSRHGLTGALDQANYCIWCHNQGKDSCSNGLHDEKTGAFQKSAFGVTLAGCPLEEKISEMNLVKAERHSDRRAGHRRHRQSDGGRHRPPHLQRLHEVLHLSEAGAGRHSAGRDAQPEGRAGAALGLRDLRPADALESARSAPAAAQAGDGYKVLVVGLGPAGFTLAHI